MMPTLEHGQDVYCLEAHFHKLKIGDIVVFTNKNNYATVHRIVARRGPFWITKGDNNKRVDRELLSIVNYIGKVI
jgi:signal peptidase I